MMRTCIVQTHAYLKKIRGKDTIDMPTMVKEIVSECIHACVFGCENEENRVPYENADGTFVSLSITDMRVHLMSDLTKRDISPFKLLRFLIPADYFVTPFER